MYIPHFACLFIFWWTLGTSIFWPLWIALLWTLVYKYLLETLHFFGLFVMCKNLNGGFHWCLVKMDILAYRNFFVYEVINMLHIQPITFLMENAQLRIYQNFFSLGTNLQQDCNTATVSTCEVMFLASPLSKYIFTNMLEERLIYLSVFPIESVVTLSL